MLKGLCVDWEWNVLKNDRLSDLVFEVFKEVENMLMKLIMWKLIGGDRDVEVFERRVNGF